MQSALCALHRSVVPASGPPFQPKSHRSVMSAASPSVLRGAHLVAGSGRGVAGGSRSFKSPSRSQQGGSRPCVARNSCKRIEKTPSIHARAAGDCTRPAPSGTRMRPIASMLCAPPVQRSPEAHTRWQGEVGEGRVGAGVVHAAPRSSDTGVVAAERSAISIVDISAADPITAAAASPAVLRGAHLVAG